MKPAEPPIKVRARTDGSITHTEETSERDPHWQVDLGQSFMNTEMKYYYIFAVHS